MIDKHRQSHIFWLKLTADRFEFGALPAKTFIETYGPHVYSDDIFDAASRTNADGTPHLPIWHVTGDYTKAQLAISVLNHSQLITPQQATDTAMRFADAFYDL